MYVPRQRHPTMRQTRCRRRQGIQIRDERLVVKSHWTHAHVLLSLSRNEASLSYLNRYQSSFTPPLPTPPPAKHLPGSFAPSFICFLRRAHFRPFSQRARSRDTESRHCYCHRSRVLLRSTIDSKTVEIRRR